MVRFSSENRQNYRQGYETAYDDFAWCKGDKQKIKDCIETRKRMLKLSRSRKNINDVSFQRGYLKYFSDRGFV